MKAKNENVVNEEEIQKTVLDVLDEKTAVPDIKESETAGGLVISDNGLKSSGDVRLAETNMIQKHLDNFLAKIAGETPVDDNPRNSTEFWLNKIAESGGGGGTKLYKHIINIYFNELADQCVLEIVNNSIDAFTLSTLANYLFSKGFKAEGLFSGGNMSHVYPAVGNSLNSSGYYFGVSSKDGANTTLWYIKYDNHNIASTGTGGATIIDTIIEL